MEKLPTDNLNLVDENDNEAGSGELETVSPVKKISYKSLALIIVEILLLVVVVALALFYFNRKNNNTKFNFFNKPADNNIVIDQSITDTDMVTSSQTNTPTNNKPTVNNPTNNNSAPVKNNEPEPDLRSTTPAPTQSMVMSEDNIPDGAIRISGTASGFSPSEFTVSPNQEITLALTVRIDLPVVLTFYNPKMAPVSIGCGPGETRWVTFKAPSEKGEYTFRNDIIGHINETGKMIVK